MSGRPLRRVALALLLGAASGAAQADDFTACLAGIRPTALAGGVSAATFDTVTAGMQPNDVAPFQDQQPEFKTPIWDYLAGLVDDERVADGRAAMGQWAKALNTAASRFGVDPATVAAVWGVESDFGRGVGRRPILQSLATLSCTLGRRQAAFRPEFIAALKIVQAGDVRPERMLGSWAGAFGQTQFMPTTFLKLAVDLDGDGRRDVVDSTADALGSTANFLRAFGWSAAQPWGFEVALPAGYTGPSGRNARAAFSTWSSRGLQRRDGRPLGEGTGALLLPAGPTGPAFLVTSNFNALYAYNNAESYALAIALLSDRLRGMPALATAWPTNDRPLARVDRRSLQTELIRHGYDLGVTDGVMGTKTQAAIADFQSRNGLTVDGRADGKVLDALRGSRAGGSGGFWPFNR